MLIGTNPRLPDRFFAALPLYPCTSNGIDCNQYLPVCNNPTEPFRKTSSGQYDPASLYDVHDRSACLLLCKGKLQRRIGQYGVGRAVTLFRCPYIFVCQSNKLYFFEKGNFFFNLSRVGIKNTLLQTLALGLALSGLQVCIFLYVGFSHLLNSLFYTSQ